MEWEQVFEKAICRFNIKQALNILEKLGTSHAGTPPSLIKNKAIKLLKRNLTDDKLEEAVVMLANNSSSVGKELSCSLLADYYPSEPNIALKLMIQLADDSNWEVRESAAYIFGDVLIKQFDEVYPVYQQIISNTTANVRRAIAVGVKYAAKKRDPRWGELFLQLIEPLLIDSNEYVRKNLGPFVVGDGLLRCYPELTIAKLQVWSKSQNENIRWNVAMSLSTAEARKHLKKVLPILSDLALDDRRFVWRAVASALRNHARAKPEVVLPKVKEWVYDSKRKNVAEIVIRFVN